MDERQSASTMANIIRPLFIALPLPKDIDADELLKLYIVALHGQSINALRSVVAMLCKGTWYDPVTFCPRPPELANMVRTEQRRMDAQNRPKLPPPAHVDTGYKDLRIMHERRSEELQRSGWRVVNTDASYEEYIRKGRRREIPVGSTHLFVTDEILVPPNAQTPAIPQEEEDAA